MKETNISTKRNRLKSLTQQEADQLAIYKHDQGVELGSTEKQLQLSGQSRLEPVISAFQVQHPNHLATLPPIKWQRRRTQTRERGEGKGGIGQKRGGRWEVGGGRRGGGRDGGPGMEEGG